jgi:hypothetical protein
VFIDSASEYNLDEVNERNYLISLFKLLSEILADDFSSFHFCLLFSRFVGTVPESRAANKPKKVLFWFAEESGELPYHICNDYLIVFKSYIKSEQQNIYSNPLGYVNEFENNNQESSIQKDINLFFAGNLNHNRRKLYELFFFKKFPYLKFLRLFPFSIPGLFFSRLGISNLSIRRRKYVVLFFDGFKKGLNYRAYRNLLSRSHYVLCPRGFISTETFRHEEALSNNCIVISESMPDVTLYANNPFLLYQSFDELALILKNIKDGIYDRRELSENHFDFYIRHLHINSVAEYISRICLSYLRKENQTCSRENRSMT